MYNYTNRPLGLSSKLETRVAQRLLVLTIRILYDQWKPFPNWAFHGIRWLEQTCNMLVKQNNQEMHINWKFDWKCRILAEMNLYWKLLASQEPAQYVVDPILQYHNWKWKNWMNLTWKSHLKLVPKFRIYENPQATLKIQLTQYLRCEPSSSTKNKE